MYSKHLDNTAKFGGVLGAVFALHLLSNLGNILGSVLGFIFS